MTTIPKPVAPGKPEAPKPYRTLELLDAIVDAPDLKGANLLVGLALLRHADAEGRCFPGVRTLAAKTGASTRTVTRAIKHLERQGWIVVERIPGRVSNYRFPPVSTDTRTTPPLTPEQHTPDTGKTVPLTPGKRKGFSTKGHIEGAQGKEKDLAPRRKRQAPEEPPDPRIQPTLKAFFSAYQERFEREPTQTAFNWGRDAKRLKKELARAESWTLDDLTRAVNVFFNPKTPGFVTRDWTFGDFLRALTRLVTGEVGAQDGKPRRWRAQYGPAQNDDPDYYSDWETGGTSP